MNFLNRLSYILSLLLLFSGFTNAQTKVAEIRSLNPYFYATFDSIDQDQFFRDSSGNSTCEWGQSLRPDLVPGILGNAFSFENKATYLKAHSYGNYKVGNYAHSTGFSISFWINIDYDHSRDNITRILDQQNVFDVLFQNNGVLFRTYGGHSYTIGGTGILDGNWHHITISLDFQKTVDNVNYYVDNVLINTVSHSFETNFSRADQRKSLHIGSRHGGGYPGHMSLDEVALFNRPITPYEVNQLYQVNQVIEQNPQEITLEINDGHTQVTEGISSSINLNAITNMTSIQNIEWKVVLGNATIQSNGSLSTTILMNDNSNYQHAKILLRVSNGNHEKEALINVVRTKENAPNVRTLSALPPPGVHPRILFGPSDLPDMRSRYASAINIQKAKNQRFTTQGIKNLPIDDRLSEHYTLLSYDALMLNDATELSKLANEFTLFVDSLAQSYTTEYTNRYNGDVDWNIGFTYDFLYNSMTGSQRDFVRSFIAKMIAHRATYGSFSEGSVNNVFEFSVNNTTHTNAYATVCAAAIEGEEGAMPELIEANEDVLRNFLCKYGVNESGFPREGHGYYSLGMRKAVFSCMIHARRGENFFETSNFYKSLEIGFREQQPWSLGDMFSHHDGQIFENGGPSGDMFWFAKYMYPNDLMVDNHIHSFDENRSYGYYFAGIGLFVFGMDAIPNNEDPGTIGAALQYPTSAADLNRGIINTRNKWSDDMVRLDFECRMDFYHFGHMHADRNSFTLSGYGRQWISDNGYHQTYSDEHSTILIDGLASDCRNRPFWPSAPGILLRYEDEEEYMITQGDATFFYNYGNNWGSLSNYPSEQLNTTWEDFSFDPNLVPEPIKDVGTGSWSRIDTVEKALRSVVFKKGDYPFAIIVDDIKKDNTPRDYEWVANLPHSFDYYNRFWFNYEILKQNNEELIFKYEKDTMANAPQLQIMLLDAAGTPDSIRIVQRDFDGVNRNLISIKRNSIVEPNFKVLLYPHRAGFPKPQTYWNSDMTLLSVFIDDEVTYVEFTEDADGCTVVNIVDLQTVCSPSSPYGNSDSDGDGVCDALDICDGFDDTIDTDNDNMPDGCDLCPSGTGNDEDNDGCDEDCDFAQVNGGALDVGSGAGKTFVVGTNDRVYQRNGGGWTILPLGPTPSRIDVDSDGNPWIVATDNKIYRLSNNQWIQVSGWATDIGCGGTNVFAVGTQNRIYKWNGGNNWSLFGNGVGKQIDVGQDGNPWIVGVDDRVYQFQNNQWQVKGTFTALEVGVQEGGQRIWAIAKSNGVVHNYLGGGVWNSYSLLADHISVNNNGDVWLVNDATQIFVSECPGPFLDIDINVALEGAYDDVTGLQSTQLLQRGLLPSGQPFNTAPWNYNGAEGQGWAISDYPAGSVDWVLVSLRREISSSSEVARIAGILLEDGSIFFPDYGSFSSALGAEFYIVIQHRNHIAAMSPTKIAVVGTSISYDFRNADGYASVGAGQKYKDNTWMLYAGDGDQLSDPNGYDINGNDGILWDVKNGTFNQYLKEDYNMDGETSGADKIIWSINNGVFSKLPK